MAKYIIKEIDMYQGDTYKEGFGMEVWDTDLTMFVPRDMTGIRMDMHVKQRASQTLVPVITASTDTGEIVYYDIVQDFDDLDAIEAVTPTVGVAAYRALDTDLLYVWNSETEEYVEWKPYEGPIMAWVQIRLGNSKTRVIRGGFEYTHDVQIIDGDDDVDTFRVGAVITEAEVTDIRP